MRDPHQNQSVSQPVACMHIVSGAAHLRSTHATLIAELYPQSASISRKKLQVVGGLTVTRRCHPERSRFSGVAKDLQLDRPNA
jgi:hypothetical protein